MKTKCCLSPEFSSTSNHATPLEVWLLIFNLRKLSPMILSPGSSVFHPSLCDPTSQTLPSGLDKEPMILKTCKRELQKTTWLQNVSLHLRPDDYLENLPTTLLVEFLVLGSCQQQQVWETSTQFSPIKYLDKCNIRIYFLNIIPPHLPHTAPAWHSEALIPGTSPCLVHTQLHKTTPQEPGTLQ